MANTPRELAYRTLLAAEKDHARPVDDLLNEALNNSTLDPRDKRWTMELVFGVTRMQLQLDAWIQVAYKGRYKKAQHAIKTLLRMGAFQLKHMQTAEHAALNETVKLCKRVGQSQARGLVNAVLRKIQTIELSQILEPISDPLKKLSIETSHPEWLLEKWLSRYDHDEVTALCRHNNRPPKVWIRRNSLRITQADFEAYLEREAVHFSRSTILESFYEIDTGGPLLRTPEFHDGWFSFQDIAAGMVAFILDPQPGETIVDACAAPGGKMAFLSELSSGQSHIIACDASQTRLGKVKQNVERLGLKDIVIRRLDATVEPLPEAHQILLDVPCSGTGVLGRRPDARWKRQASDSSSLVGIQTNIIKNSWKYLKPGGILVYATCTLEPEENWALIDSVVESLENAEFEPITAEKIKPFIDERGALATLPWNHDMDGMFAVKIRKAL
ncbi:MAG: 16S rRNA (cytosine(967)-C(5))-methyltransferase RsmB [Candidatus Marinimicrobia bacterium]|nr:16S rRNA (cytosine(967)-C(5))-methyltransferase RsmB [Candidatus Neomarinimicrobiota bacterium]